MMLIHDVVLMNGRRLVESHPAKGDGEADCRLNVE